jgi:hypothetical protein
VRLRAGPADPDGHESVWQVHEKATAVDEEDRKALEAEREVTLVLIRYRSRWRR